MTGNQIKKKGKVREIFLLPVFNQQRLFIHASEEAGWRTGLHLKKT